MPTLYDGREVASDSAQWMRECEARAICAMPRRDDRLAYVERIALKRGRAASDELKRLVRLAWGQRGRGIA